MKFLPWIDAINALIYEWTILNSITLAIRVPSIATDFPPYAGSLITCTSWVCFFFRYSWILLLLFNNMTLRKLWSVFSQLINCLKDRLLRSLKTRIPYLFRFTGNEVPIFLTTTGIFILLIFYLLHDTHVWNDIFDTIFVGL